MPDRGDPAAARRADLDPLLLLLAVAGGREQLRPRERQPDRPADRDVELIDGQWVADSPMGRVVVAFAPPNDFGVLDHDVTLPAGETVRNPMRVIPNGDGCDVVFTVHRRPGVSETEFAADVEAVTADLDALRALMER